ncbi:MAG: hypothetical protein JWM87_3178 [Candidatus Eremiobacteraeota bacterium]|nr:hypothetical protein [Candidatus Eremiobacteraeota bacterium]
MTFQRTPQADRELGPNTPRSHGALPLAAAGEAVLLPVSDAEAFWVGFDAEMTGCALCFRVTVLDDHGFASDAIAGGPWLDALSGAPQNYVVCPPQYALAGVTRPGGPRPFARVTQLPDRYQACRSLTISARRMRPRTPSGCATGAEAISHSGSTTARPMAIGPTGTAAVSGGADIVPDPYGPQCWDDAPAVTLRVVLVSYERFRDETGRTPPALDPASSYGGWRLP